MCSPENRTCLIAVRCRCSIPPIDELATGLTDLMSRDWVDKEGVNLLTEETLRVHASAMKLVLDGRMSGVFLRAVI